MHAAVCAPLIDSRRILPRRIVGLALDLDKVWRLNHGMFLRSHLVRLIRAHLLVVVADWGRTRVGVHRLTLVGVLLSLVVAQVLGRINLVELVVFEVFARVASGSVPTADSVVSPLLFLWATWVLVLILLRLLIILLVLLIQVHVVTRWLLLAVLNAHWTRARTHLL